MGVDLSPEDIASLVIRTEGWIAGLQMAALSMRDREDVRGFIEGFSGTHRHILDYLLEEILAGQSPEIQHFLLFTSILERLTAPLCDAVLKSDEGSKWEGDDRSTHSESLALRQSSSILEYLERANLFLVPLDDERLWYRYHHLFADLLRARLHQAQPDSIRLLRIRAAAWLEQNGYISEAIQQLFTAKEIGQAADLIERYGPVSWTESDPSVMRMADSLPPEMLVTRPKIGLYQAWLLICQGNIEKAIPLLTDLAQHLAAAEPDPRLRWMQTFIALALAFLFQANPLPEYQELDEIPAIEPILRDAADVLYGMALGRRGETDRAAEISVRCIQREKTSQGMLAFPSLASFLAVIYLMQGRLHTAASLCREYIDPIQEKGFRIVSTAGNMEIVLGEVQYEWNQLDKAERQIREGLQANEPWQNIMTDAFGLLALVLVLRAKGDYAGAMQIVTKFETRLQGDSRPREFQEDFRTLRVRVQLASGDLQNAVQWAEQVQQSEDFHLHEGYYQLTLAHIRLAQGKHTEVEKMLTEAPSLEVIGNRISRQIEINLLLAAAIAGQNRVREAYELIESCLVLAEPEGYIQVFLEGGEPVRELLAAYLNAPACEHKNYVQKILEAFGPTEVHEAVGVQRASQVDILTPRELDVLRLLAEGCSNRQIAEKLFLAEGTVKFYLHTVLEKLGVHSRTQAILVAKERNLV
jgi:LuxR family maltose regulon positive regulatory protein